MANIFRSYSYSYRVPYIGGSFFDGDYKRTGWGGEALHCDGNTKIIFDFFLSVECNGNQLGLIVVIMGFIVATTALILINKKQYTYLFNYLI
jgi:hypothetical protein